MARHRAARVGLTLSGVAALLAMGAGTGEAATAAPAPPAPSPAAHAALHASMWHAAALARPGGTSVVQGRSVHAAQANLTPDPSGDEINGSGTRVDVPQADIQGAGIGDDTSVSPADVRLIVSVTTYSDPSTDPAWSNPATLIDWEIDTTVAGSDQYDVAFGSPGAGLPPQTVVYDNVTKQVTCDSTQAFTPDPANATYQVDVPATCIGSPSFFRWNVGMGYDPVAGDTGYVDGAVDLAPDSAALTPPQGEPTVTATPNFAFPADGYWTTTPAGDVFNHGSAQFFGSLTGVHLNQPIVSVAGDQKGDGYWMVASDGGVFTFGNAPFHGSLGNVHLNKPIVALIPTKDDGGYWLIASDGGVFTFGDAVYQGSLGNVRLNQPIVGGARTASGNGYWLVASDGGIFTFGDAAYHGSTGNLRLNQPVVAMAATPTGDGYWLVAADGGIFTFGGAGYHGSTGNIRLNAPIIGISPSTDGAGYLMVANDGGVFTFGDAEFEGSEGNSGLGNIFNSVATAPGFSAG